MKIRTFIILIAFSHTLLSQEKSEMSKLDFMIGNWIGTSTVYEDGKVTKQGSAYQEITYDLDQHLLLINLKSEFLQLHTVIYYDEKDKCYYYNPFSKRGARKLPASLENNRLVVSSGEDRRFIFSRLENGGFREYGEQLVDGNWVKYFEDIFQAAK